MILFLVLSAALWAMGSLLGMPARARWLMISLLYVAFLLALVVLPEGVGLRRSIGGSFGEWLVLGGLAALVYGYRAVLGRIRRRAAPAGEKPKGDFGETELERYARHVILREIGGLGQKRLKQARVLVVGAGGLGSPALMYLAAAGAGTIGVIDSDVVENTNLQRQVIHSDERIGMPKVFSAKTAMTALNPYVEVRPYHRRFDAAIADELVAGYDIVLDGTDNFDTRYLVNAACVKAGVPLVSAAITQWEGQIGVFDPGAGGPCYRCVFPEAPAPGLVPACAEAGVVGPLPGVLGAMMAVECIKVITKAGEPLRGRLMIYDALYAEARVITAARRADCEVCGSGA